jgi:hypothetical protein
MVYRFHTDSPVPFDKYFKMSIEHGHANHRSDNFYLPTGINKAHPNCVMLCAGERADSPHSKRWRLVHGQALDERRIAMSNVTRRTLLKSVAGAAATAGVRAGSDESAALIPLCERSLMARFN